jgi:hypothetical protein
MRNSPATRFASKRNIHRNHRNQSSPSELFHFAVFPEPKHLEKLIYFTCLGFIGTV